MEAFNELILKGLQKCHADQSRRFAVFLSHTRHKGILEPEDLDQFIALRSNPDYFGVEFFLPPMLNRRPVPLHGHVRDGSTWSWILDGIEQPMLLVSLEHLVKLTHTGGRQDDHLRQLFTVNPEDETTAHYRAYQQDIVGPLAAWNYTDITPIGWVNDHLCLIQLKLKG